MFKFKPLTMSVSKYVLKAGVLLQAFSDASKTCTNANITDELAEYHLKINPACARFFAVLPGIPSVTDSVLKPKTGGPTIIVPPERAIPGIVNDFVKAASEPPASTKPKAKHFKSKK